MKSTPHLLVLCAVALAPYIAHAQDMAWLNSFSGGLLSILSVVGSLLISLAVAVFSWGVVMFITKAGDEKARTEGKRKMVWGIVSIFIIVSVWGFVALIQTITATTPEDVVAPRSR